MKLTGGSMEKTRIYRQTTLDTKHKYVQQIASTKFSVQKTFYQKAARKGKTKKKKKTNNKKKSRALHALCHNLLVLFLSFMFRGIPIIPLPVQSNVNTILPDHHCS